MQAAVSRLHLWHAFKQKPQALNPIPAGRRGENLAKSGEAVSDAVSLFYIWKDECVPIITPPDELMSLYARPWALNICVNTKTLPDIWDIIILYGQWLRTEGWYLDLLKVSFRSNNCIWM